MTVIEKKIMIVDDEQSIRDVLKKAFERTGYTVFEAESAEACLEILKQESIMVYCLDLNLPGMSGIELCSKLKKDNPIGIFFAVTGYADLFGLIECRKAGFDDFFTKPVQLRELIQVGDYAFDRLERWQVEKYELL